MAAACSRNPPLSTAAKDVVIRMQTTGGPADSLGQIRELLRRARGRCGVYFEVQSLEGWKATLRARTPGVEPTEQLLAALDGVPGVLGVQCCG